MWGMPKSYTNAAQSPSTPLVLAYKTLHPCTCRSMQGKIFLVLTDVHSKWLKICQFSSTSSSVIIQHLQKIFCQFGLPHPLVSDNGPQFSLSYFAKGMVFTTSWLPPITHHCWTCSLSRVLRNSKKTLGNSGFVDYCWLTPHSTTGKTSTELMQDRQPRSRLDLLKPDLETTVYKKQDNQKRAHDKTAVNRNFQEGEKVYAKKIILFQAPHGCLVR